MDMLLEVKNLTVELSIKDEFYQVIHSLNFQLNEMSSLGIVGESGSGKSITVLTILDLLPKNSRVVEGEIFFNGRDLLKLSKEERRKLLGKEIGMIFQNPMTSLDPLMNVYHLIGETIVKHQPSISDVELKKKVIDLLQAVKIVNPEEFMYKYPHELSGGQRQRVVIASSIANQPKLLIADEATTALDVTVQYEIVTLIDELIKKNKMSLIFISHDLGLIRHICDDVAIMYCGEIIEIGHEEEIFKNTNHPYTIELLKSLPEFAKKGEPLNAIEGRVPSLTMKKENCPFFPRCKKHFEKCVNEPIPIKALTSSHFSKCAIKED